MQKKSKKQLLAHRVNTIVVGILNTLTEDTVTLAIAQDTLPRTTSYKDHNNGA